MVFGLMKIGLPTKKQPAEPPPKAVPTDGKKVPQGGGSKSALTVNEFVARTKRQREKGLEPTKPELIAYARYLGIDPISDGDLMWIAEECLNAPLPSEWTEHHDSADRVFYYNVQTHSSSWTHPLEQLHRDTYKRIVSFRNGDMSKDDQIAELEKLRRQCEDAEREAHMELQAWTEHIDEQGQKFYFNREHQRSVWTDPRPAKCHDLYLQMKAIRVLSKSCGQSIAGRGVDDVMRPNLGSLDRMRSESMDREGDKSEDKDRKRKKKRKDKEQKMEAPLLDGEDDDSPRGNSVGLSGAPNIGGGGGGVGLPLGFGKANGSALDLKRPGTSVVEEVRQALGVAPGGGLPPMGHGGRGFGAGAGGAGGLTGSPGSGRKVRAGIKLEPLK